MIQQSSTKMKVFLKHIDDGDLNDEINDDETLPARSGSTSREQDLSEIDTKVTFDNEEGPTIPDKSRSLRARSVQKRLQTELKMSGRKKRDPAGKGAKMTKYRRKAANAKERERMAKVNEAFERLREVMPDLNLILQDEKDTKVTTLKAAITYIYGLQNLLEDINTGNIDPVKYKLQEPQVCHKKPLKPTKSALKTRSLNPAKPTTKPQLKISPVTLTVKGSGKKCERRAQAKYILPLTHRQESELCPSGVSLPKQPEQNVIQSQMVQNLKVTPVASVHPSNLIFLEPIQESVFGKERADKVVPLPSMHTLLPSVSHKNETCEYYVVLKNSDDFVSPVEDFRLRRDSGGSTGFSFRSLSSSPDSTLSNRDIEMDGMENMDGMDSMDCEDYVKGRTVVPESPTDLVPTIDQLFSRPTPDQRIDNMEQFVILEDIHQIIGETCNIISS